MVEAQSLAHLPLDPVAEAHLAADMSSMFYLKVARQLNQRGGEN